MIIEVISDTLSDALIAQEAGADRIELVTGLGEGGLTPSYGVIESVCRKLTIPVNVMIRPHSRGFCYSEEDIEIMIQDIKVCRKLGAAGVVFGVLTSDYQVHTDHLKRLIDASEGLGITFHRAIDDAEDQFAALKIIKQHPQISRILTSGGQKSAILTANNIKMFLEKVPVNEIHFGSGVRYHSSYEHAISPEKIQAIKNIADL
jgi:copper homeostasis protein